MSTDTTEKGLAFLMQEFRTWLTADVVTGKLDVRPAAAKLLDMGDAEPETEALEEPEADEGQVE